MPDDGEADESGGLAPAGSRDPDAVEPAPTAGNAAKLDLLRAQADLDRARIEAIGQTIKTVILDNPGIQQFLHDFGKVQLAQIEHAETKTKAESARAMQADRLAQAERIAKLKTSLARDQLRARWTALIIVILSVSFLSLVGGLIALVAKDVLKQEHALVIGALIAVVLTALNSKAKASE